MSTGFFDIHTVGIVNGIIAMCMPLLLRLFYSAVDQVQKGLSFSEFLKWWQGRQNKHQRFIVYRSTRNSWGGMTSLSSDTQNAVLIKAIQLYLHRKCNLDLNSANLDLTSMEDKTQGGYYGYDSEDDQDQSSPRKTLVGMLSKYSIVKKPLQRQWHHVGAFSSLHSDGKCYDYPVELRIEEYEEEMGKNDGQSRQLCTTKLHFVSSGPTSIDTFIDKAYSWYMGELRSLENDSRYLYELQSKTSTSRRDSGDNYGDRHHDGPVHVRYKLSDEKTFESLFFQEKASLLRLIQHFTKKTGKYAIKGYPHKLGLLLHGPPGTGKTSLIKALAQHTGRSIVNVPLSKISTNSELMSIFFDNKYYIKGEDVPVRLGFRDVIFVMEDVDACSKIVRRRSGKTTDEPIIDENLDFPLPKSIWRMLLESNDQDCRELIELLISKSDRLKNEAKKPEVLRSLAERLEVLPGLGLVGESGCEGVVRKIGDEAIETANILMDGYATVERFIGTHARAIKALLEAGAEVDDSFVDKILGNEASELFDHHGLINDLATTIDREQLVTANKLVHAGDEGIGELGMIGPKEKMGFKVEKDQLNLTGLLNVLDGIVDTPGRILIMTTNHPELLDPALVRPGRIDKKLILGYMSANDVLLMLEHYFQTKLSDAQQHRVRGIINGNTSGPRRQLNLTPAQVEQLTAEYDDIEVMIRALEEKCGRNLLNNVQFGGGMRKGKECDIFRGRSDDSQRDVKRRCE